MVSYCPRVLLVSHWPGESVLFNAFMWCLPSSRWVDCMLEQQDCFNIHWDIVSTSTFPTTIILWLCAQSNLLITMPSLSKILLQWRHNGVIASQITSLTIVYSNVYSDADQRKHQSPASLAFVRGIHRGPVNSPHKWSLTRKCFHLMTSSCSEVTPHSWHTRSKYGVSFMILMYVIYLTLVTLMLCVILC